MRPGLALAVLALSGVLVADQRYVRGEGVAVEAINDLPRALGAPLEAVMGIGTLAAGLIITALVAVGTLRPRPTLAVGLATIVAWRLDNVLKELIERPRPPAVLEGLHLREPGTSGWGFPSGHTAMAFALAAALHPILPPRWRWVAWTLALAVGVARMYVGVHWPMDVVGGAVLGIAIGGTTGLLVTDRYRPRPA